jgi:hypothetical protein
VLSAIAPLPFGLGYARERSGDRVVGGGEAADTAPRDERAVAAHRRSLPRPVNRVAEERYVVSAAPATVRPQARQARTLWNTAPAAYHPRPRTTNLSSLCGLAADSAALSGNSDVPSGRTLATGRPRHSVGILVRHEEDQSHRAGARGSSPTSNTIAPRGHSYAIDTSRCSDVDRGVTASAQAEGARRTRARLLSSGSPHGRVLKGWIRDRRWFSEQGADWFPRLCVPRPSLVLLRLLSPARRLQSWVRGHDGAQCPQSSSGLRVIPAAPANSS